MLERNSFDRELGQICLEDLVKVKPVTFDSIRSSALNLFIQKVSIPPSVKDELKRVKLRYVAKCERVYQLIATEISAIARLPINELHPFYLELLNIASDGHYQDIIKSAKKIVVIASDLWREYRRKILNSSSHEEAKKLAREFVGRILSLVKRNSHYFSYLQEITKTVKTTPCVVTEWPTVIVAGMPQVGKSTLVSRISSAKPKISPYPFTTKTVIMGHVKLKEGLYLQILDTPGILDRPLEDLNSIERKAIATLRYLKAVTVYLMDPSPDSYYSFESQLNVLKSVESIVGKERIFVVFNKIDKVDNERVRKCADLVEKVAGFQVRLAISALHGYNVDKLLNEVLKLYDTIYGTSYHREL
jgi:nucleolar GTP-binding protein